MNRDKWTYKTMGEVGSFLRGKSILKSDFVEKGMPCIHYGQVHTKFGISVDKHLSEIPDELYKKSIIASPGDTIIAITSEDLDGSCKSTEWMGNCDVAVSAHAAVYKHNFVPKFIPYYLRSHSFYVEKEKYARGFKVMEIKPSDIAKIPVPIPSKETQNFIVSELDAINESITMLQLQVSDLDILAQSLFYNMFGDPVANPKSWPIKSMGEVAPCVAFKGTIEPISGKYWLLNLDMVESQTGKILAKNLCDASEIGNSTNVFSEENVLYSKLRPYLNKVVLPNEKGYCTSELLPLLPKKDYLDRVFLALLLRSNSFVNYINNRVAGAKMPRVSMNDFRSFNVILPPLSFQKSFASKMAAIEETKASLNSQIAEMQKLLASRMQYWFD